MGSCNIDHSIEDVYNKLESQKEFLPLDIINKCTGILAAVPTQTKLNELFHLLKKYDLVTEDERLSRIQKILEM